MRPKPLQRRSKGDVPRRPTQLLVLAVVILLLLSGGWWFSAERNASSPLQRASAATHQIPHESVPELTDSQLQRAADELLATVDPKNPQNQYFPEFARERLSWIIRESTLGRLDVAFFNNTRTVQLPDDVLMAAWRRDGLATIFIGKPRFAQFLIEGGATVAPFTQQQRNDFALALVHEVLHLQNPAADPRDPKARLQEESRAWREVTMKVVRDLVAYNQPVHQRFRDVDTALRACRDQLPCPALGQLVRLGL